MEKILESPMNSKEIQPVYPEGNLSWIFIGSTDAEAEAPILCPPDAKDQLIGKDSDAGKDWRQEEKGMTEDETVRWHHRLIDMNLSKLRELVMDGETWHTAVHGVSKSQTWLSGLNWTDPWQDTWQGLTRKQPPMWKPEGCDLWGLEESSLPHIAAILGSILSLRHPSYVKCQFPS